MLAAAWLSSVDEASRSGRGGILGVQSRQQRQACAARHPARVLRRAALAKRAAGDAVRVDVIPVNETNLRLLHRLPPYTQARAGREDVPQRAQAG